MKKKMMNKKEKKYNIVMSYEEVRKVQNILIAYATHIEFNKIPEWERVGMSQKYIDSLIKEKEEAEKMYDILFDRFIDSKPAGE